MNAAAARNSKPFQQDLRHYRPRWMIVFVAVTILVGVGKS
jgi:hypothetical protein